MARGDVVAGAAAQLSPTFVVDAALAPTYRIDVALVWSAGAARPAHGDRVQVHHGTREAPARLAELGGRFWQLRLEQPLVPAAGDRVVIRSIAPPDTLGGGVVLDPAPRRHGPSRDAIARLARLERGEELASDRELKDLVPEGAPSPPRDLAPTLSPAAIRLEARLREAGFEPPIETELGDLASELPTLRAAGRAVRVGRALHYHPEALDEVERRVVELCERAGEATIAGLRDELGTSRKFAQALLEHFDGEKLTRRVGDAHVLRGRRRKE